jgi:hypothetical protein
MKTLKFLMVAILLGTVGSAFAQSPKPAAKNQTFLVQIPHTPEQCLSMMDDMKGKGEAFLSKFEFGCMSGDHTAYAFIEAPSADNVKMMLPANEQKTAKITKVDKMTAAQIEKIHKDHM